MENLQYSDNEDQEWYGNATISLGGIVVEVAAATVASQLSKLNEDACAVSLRGDALLVGVFDGTTNIKPIASLTDQTGARFASHFVKKAFEEVRADDCREILLELNNRLGKRSLEFAGTSLSDMHTLPTTTATIVRLDAARQQLSFGHAGDCSGVVFYNDGRSEVFTDDRNKAFDEQMYAIIQEVAVEKGITIREARHDARVHDALMDMYNRRNNHPDCNGCGLMNGDPNVELYIQTGSVPLDTVKAILLCTDGLLPQGWSIEREEDRQRLLEIVARGGFREMFEIKHKSEADDPDWSHVRYKHSDDATGVLIRFR